MPLKHNGWDHSPGGSPTTGYKMIIDILLLIWLHFVADFLLQTDKVAQAKSKCNKTLLLHVTLYSLPFLLYGWLYALVNGVLHFITDYISGRVASHFYKNEERHWFFVTIGFDQAIHITTLLITYQWLIK